MCRELKFIDILLQKIMWSIFLETSSTLVVSENIFLTVHIISILFL